MIHFALPNCLHLQPSNSQPQPRLLQRPAPEQQKIQAGIASAKDSFEAKQTDSLFTANPNTGELNFGDGLSGKTPPIGNQNITATYRHGALIKETKAEISSYLKGEGGTASSKLAEPFRGMKEYLNLSVQNEKIDSQMQEAKEKADTAMGQATTEMVTGSAAGLNQIGAAVAGLKDIASQARSDLRQIDSPAIESRYQRFTSLLNDLEKASDKTQKEIYKQEQEANKAATAESENDSDTSASGKLIETEFEMPLWIFFRKCARSIPKSSSVICSALIQRQFHFFHEGGVTRVLLNVAKQRIAFHFSKTAVTLLISAFEPFECFICLTTESINLSDLKSRSSLINLQCTLANNASASFFLPAAKLPRASPIPRQTGSVSRSISASAACGFDCSK